MLSQKNCLKRDCEALVKVDFGIRLILESPRKEKNVVVRSSYFIARLKRFFSLEIFF